MHEIITNQGAFIVLDYEKVTPLRKLSADRSVAKKMVKELPPLFILNLYV